MTKQKKAKAPPKKALKSNENKEIAKRLKIDKETKDKAFLYYVKGLTCKEVAKLLDLSFRTVQNWQSLEKWTEKLNPDSIKNKCFELKTKGISYKEIAKMFSISVSTVQRYVNESKKIDDSKTKK